MPGKLTIQILEPIAVLILGRMADRGLIEIDIEGRERFEEHRKEIESSGLQFSSEHEDLLRKYELV